jgi:hypothetical protein
MYLRSYELAGLLLLASCQQAVAPAPNHPATVGATAEPPKTAAGAAPVAANGARASQAIARFHVPPLPPDVAVPRWQQFCWSGSEALAHLNEAGEQGWELVSVTVAATPEVAIPQSTFEPFQGQVVRTQVMAGTQMWLVCFKRPILSAH